MKKWTGAIAYGGDYNPEQWPESVWAEDMRLMRAAGVTMVTVAVFAWSRLQPTAETWDFGWLDRCLDRLHEHGIAVDLATATASPPPWFSLRHPESLPVRADGTRLGIGSRQHICPSSEAFAEAAAKLVTRMAERYGEHPALSLWHVGNEYGDHIEQCYCDASAAHFRRWLRDRYRSLEALNEAWNTDVWSGRFSGWDEVMPPRAAPAPLRPSLMLDYRRFSSDALLDCFERERRILRAATPDVPITTNFMRPTSAIDQWAFAAREDVVSCDIYPDPLDPQADVDAGFTHDLMRSLGRGRPWLVLEQAPGAVDWRAVNPPTDAAVIRRRSLEAVGAGADGIMFFQWRGSRSGPEMLHSAMLPAGGEIDPGWAATMNLGRDLGLLAEVAGTTCPPTRAAMLLDWHSWWALELEGHPSDALRLRELLLAAYGQLRAAGLSVDMRHPDDDLDGYGLVVVPNLVLLSRAASERLTDFVADGGLAIVGPFSGIVLPNYELAGGAHPAMLRDLLGIAVQEWWPIVEGSAGISFDGGPACRASIWRERIALTTAEEVARFDDAPLAGSPAITRNAVGRGQAWYLGTVPDDDAMSRTFEMALAEASIERIVGLPAGVDARRRSGRGVDYLFLANRNAEAVTIDLGLSGVDLLTATTVDGPTTIPGQGVQVVRLEAT